MKPPGQVDIKTKQEKKTEEAATSQKRLKTENKVFVQILPTDSQLIKDDTVEELFLSFHA